MDHSPGASSEARTGHGRDRDGAVPATELVHHLPDGWRDESGVLDLEPDVPRDADLTPRNLSTLLILAALCLVLLCGATAGMSAITSYSPRHAGESTRQEVTPISGARTFRPDLLHPARWPFTADPDSRGAAGSGDDQPASASEGPKTPPRGEIRTPGRTTTEFYSLLNTDPEGAVDMLSPELIGDQRDEIVRTWREITSVRATRVRPGPDGSVLAEVAVEYPDGDRITSHHELVVGPHQRIVGARLRTARLAHAG